jgi:ferredoxin-type protein NapF
MSTASSALSRRQLLRGRFRPGPQPIRPPWTTEASIAAHCERCGLCAQACPENIIHAGENGLPEIRFASGECSFCGACADVCPAPVFAARETAPWRLRPAIGQQCLSTHGIYCRSCGDACPERAIRFRAMLGGRAEITIDQDACTGCGACVSVCPQSVVAMTAPQSAEEVAHG